MKKVLITGNRGYIGTNLTTYLTKCGFKIGGIDKRDSLYCENFKLPKKSDLFGIVHLAATANIEYCNQNTSQAIKDNIIASQNIFEEAAEANIPVIVASSQAVKNPTNTYALTKAATEEFAEHYICQGADIKILRFANVFGGKLFIETKTSVIAKFIRARQNNEPLIINGDGQQTRDFVHVDDVCEAIMFALYYEDPVEEPIDIGTGKGRSILSIAQIISDNIVYNKNGNNLVGVFSNIAHTQPAYDVYSFKAKRSVEEYLQSVLDELP